MLFSRGRWVRPDAIAMDRTGSGGAPTGFFRRGGKVIPIHAPGGGYTPEYSEHLDQLIKEGPERLGLNNPSPIAGKSAPVPTPQTAQKRPATAGKSRPSVVHAVDQEARAAAAFGHLTLPVGPDGKLNPHLADAYKRALGKTGHEVGEFKPGRAGHVTATVTRKGATAGEKTPYNAFVQPKTVGGEIKDKSKNQKEIQSPPATEKPAESIARPAAEPSPKPAASPEPQPKPEPAKAPEPKPEPHPKAEEPAPKKGGFGRPMGTKPKKSGDGRWRMVNGRPVFIQSDRKQQEAPAATPGVVNTPTGRVLITEPPAQTGQATGQATRVLVTPPPGQAESEPKPRPVEAPAEPSATPQAKPAAPQKAKEPKGDKAPTKAEIERHLLDVHARETGADQRDVDDERSLSDFHAPFAFHGKLPGEVKDFLEGRAHLKRLFTVTDDPNKAQGADAMGKLGGDRYFALAERGRSSRIGEALEHARNHPDPEVRLQAKIYDTMPRREDRGAVEKVAPERLDLDTAGTINGIPVKVTLDEDGHKILQDGGHLPETPVDALTRPLPFDKGSVHKEEPQVPDFGAPAETRPPERIRNPAEMPDYQFHDPHSGRLTDAGLAERSESAAFRGRHPLPGRVPGLNLDAAQVRRDMAEHRARRNESRRASAERGGEPIRRTPTGKPKTHAERQAAVAELQKKNPGLSYRDAWMKVSMGRGFFRDAHGKVHPIEGGGGGRASEAPVPLVAPRRYQASAAPGPDGRFHVVDTHTGEVIEKHRQAVDAEESARVNSEFVARRPSTGVRDSREPSKAFVRPGGGAHPFAGTKVADETGNPKTVYHGTAYGGFQSFDKAHDSGSNLYGPGFYFTEDKAVAESYTRKGAGLHGEANPHLLESHLDIRNPWDVDNLSDEQVEKFARWDAARKGKTGRWDDPAAKANILKYQRILLKKSPTYKDPAVPQYIRDQGHDGLTHIGGHIMGGGHEHRVWVAFEPHQIRHADAPRTAMSRSTAGQSYWFTNAHGQRVFAQGHSQGGLFGGEAAKAAAPVPEVQSAPVPKAESVHPEIVAARERTAKKVASEEEGIAAQAKRLSGLGTAPAGNPTVDTSRQFGIFAKDAAGNPQEVGERAGQADLFNPTKYKTAAPPPEPEPVKPQFDPKHTSEMFPSKGLLDELPPPTAHPVDPTPATPSAKATAPNPSAAGVPLGSRLERIRSLRKQGLTFQEAKSHQASEVASGNELPIHPDLLRGIERANESDQDRSWREYRENAGRVAADPHAASAKDLERATGYLHAARSHEIRKAEREGREAHPELLRGYDNEIAHYDQLVRQKRTAPASATDPATQADLDRVHREAVERVRARKAGQQGKTQMSRLFDTDDRGRWITNHEGRRVFVGITPMASVA